MTFSHGLAQGRLDYIMTPLALPYVHPYKFRQIRTHYKFCQIQAHYKIRQIQAHYKFGQIRTHYKFCQIQAHYKIRQMGGITTYNTLCILVDELSFFVMKKNYREHFFISTSEI